MARTCWTGFAQQMPIYSAVFVFFSVWWILFFSSSLLNSILNTNEFIFVLFFISLCTCRGNASGMRFDFNWVPTHTHTNKHNVLVKLWLTKMLVFPLEGWCGGEGRRVGYLCVCVCFWACQWTTLSPVVFLVQRPCPVEYIKCVVLGALTWNERGRIRPTLRIENLYNSLFPPTDFNSKLI